VPSALLSRWRVGSAHQTVKLCGMSPRPVRHPLFARAYHRLARAMERDLGDRRRELLSGLSGRVLELGAGNGMNFRHYPSTVKRVLAVEPESYLRERAQQSAEKATVECMPLRSSAPCARATGARSRPSL